jgi:molybdopterin-containing oxidoreductase family iron-sulfur binding subunit
LVIRKTGKHHQFAVTQRQATMEGRDLARVGTLADYRRDPHFATDAPRKRTPDASLYPEWKYEGYKWGMAIDLNACIGCNACTIACQAENNIPTVGKEQVMREREMHWIRVDRYDTGKENRLRTVFQPVPCMHCEEAPCEEVCPVGATVHDSEGLNVQVYNRCVGTRFCSNNCPYKVRRFNFLQYSNNDVESLKAAQNPEVTVRRRGVMEKCTYCLQRITRARTEAEKLGRRLQDGEVVTACQAVCPTEAIVFGDLNNPKSAVNRAKASPLDYALLAELNTRPRTSYGAKVVNEDEDLA